MKMILYSFVLIDAICLKEARCEKIYTYSDCTSDVNERESCA